MARIIDAYNTVRTICGYYCGCERDECGADEPCEAVAFIEDAPTVSPDEVRGAGKWLNASDEFGTYEKCSCCGKEYYCGPIAPFNYCPSCGAMMEVSEDA